MGPQKAPLTFNFAQGLDLKSDPKQVPAGKFLSLVNSVFNKGGLLQKRNGFGALTLLPNSNATFLTTYNGNLTAISKSINALSTANNKWVTKGNIQPLQLNTKTLIRSNTNQSQADISISSNGLICTAYTDQDPTNLSSPQYKYVVALADTGQNVIEPTVIVPNSGVVSGAPRVFFTGHWFIIVFTTTAAGADHLEFIAINIANCDNITPAAQIDQYKAFPGLSFDGVVLGTKLFIAYNSTSGGQSIKIRYINNSLGVSSPTTFAGYKATIMGMTLDNTNPTVPVIYASFYDSVSTNGFTLAINELLQTIMAPAQIITAENVINIAPVGQNGSCTTYYEIINAYGYDSAIPTDYIKSVSVPFLTGVPTSPYVVARSVGLASKTFVIDGVQYFLAAYQSDVQPTYFLIDGTNSTQESPVVVSKLAYQNGGGYLRTGLPNVIIDGNSASIPYLFKDLVTAVNKNTNVPTGSQVDGIYSQDGINYATFTLGTEEFDSVEIASALHMSGGFLWMYDGYLPVEHNFFLYPDSVEITPHNSGGAMSAQKYFYQVIYEWTDNQGNAHRSAPSIPVEVDMSSSNSAFTPPTPITFTGDGTQGQFIVNPSSLAGLEIGQVIEDTTTPGNIQANSYITSFNLGFEFVLNLPLTATFTGDSLQTSTICSATINIPTLRLTYKTANPVKAVIYRWSQAQQEYFQVTSIDMPLLNDTTVDYVSFTDTAADSTILGNALLYTTGGVVEDIGAPASNIMTLWQTRLFLVDAEDRNLIWYSKQVIENTPVEMSDLFTIYVPPTIGASGSTGFITAMGAMDDKLIIFKRDAINYISGTGPDNTGASNNFTDPIFVTSVTGCTNQQSIVNTPMGLLFQSDKGIWILDRSLSTNYIGAPVESLVEGANVLSAILIPGTNQVRFTLDTGITLMYDYYYQQWSSFQGIPGISSCIYNNLHTYLNSFGEVFQETPGQYLDGTTPTVMSFTTGWLNLAGFQGYQRLYEFALVGDYISPHTLDIRVAYDFRAPQKQSMVRPTNFTGKYGSDSLYGQTTPYGGPGSLEQWRIHAKQQKCQVFQITLNEVYDSQFGNLMGAGLTLSGINCEVGIKKAYRPYKGANSVG